MTSRASATSATPDADAANATRATSPDGPVLADVRTAPDPTSDAWRSRAVVRAVQPGSWVECKHCGEQVKYQVRAHHMQMICNVYTDGKWNRVEHFHADCYGESGSPYGPPVED